MLPWLSPKLRLAVDELKRKWFVWIGLFALALIKDRVEGFVNSYIDSHAGLIARLLSVLFAPGDTGLFGFALAVILVLIVHAYYRSVVVGASVQSTVTKQNKKSEQTQGYPSDPESLQDRVTSLAHELLGFLKENGPRPEVPINDSMSDEEILEAGEYETGRWVDRIHYGYPARFEDRVSKVTKELKAEGLSDQELDTCVSPQVQNDTKIRTLAEKLLLLRNKLEMRPYEASTIQPFAKVPELACMQGQYVLYDILPSALGHGIYVSNVQTDYEIEARNLRAYIRFHHEFEGDVNVSPGTWIENTPTGQKCHESLSIGMDEKKFLLLFLWNANHVPVQFTTADKIPLAFSGTKLAYGKWSIKIHIKGDNIEKNCEMALKLKPTGSLVTSQITCS